MAEYKLTGYCCQCGQCCRAGFVHKRMCLNKNIIDGVQYCDFLEKRIDGKFYCPLVEKVKEFDETFSISKSIDPSIITPIMRTSLDMTDEQVKWTCSVMHFPDPNNRDWRAMLDNKLRWGLEKCTFSYEATE